MITGLMGAHRTGKSTLAREYAKKHKIAFLETSTSAIFRELGFDPSVTYDFGTRLDIQEEILKRFDVLYASHRCDQPAITDRTPLDMLAYTLGDVNGEALKPEHEPRLTKYIEDCIAVINRRFSVLLVIQPGIEVVAAEGKASLSSGYIEHFNALIMGLAIDERVKVPHYYMPRRTLDIKERLSAVEYSINRVKRLVREESDLSALH